MLSFHRLDVLFCIFFLSLIVHLNADAQPSSLGNWLIAIGDKRFNAKWNWHQEIQYRNFNFLGDTEQLLLRTGVGYNLSENNNNVLMGYAYVYSEPYASDGSKSSFSEHRLYQQFITRQTFGRFSIQHRYRFEERFLPDDFRLRFRYFLALNVALSKKLMTDGTLYLSAYNEIFLHTDNNYFDRDRIYGGLGYRFNSICRLEFGLMSQVTSTQTRNQLNFFAYFNY